MFGGLCLGVFGEGSRGVSVCDLVLGFGQVGVVARDHWRNVADSTNNMVLSLHSNILSLSFMGVASSSNLPVLVGNRLQSVKAGCMKKYRHCVHLVIISVLCF